ncbi:conserved hypothetical protein [Flavobacterium psychrophilum]|uniref:hypothetical protein n=1 Tax=Flavobacterium psychrophilum TaxID=96345 RepID=UPI000B7C1E7E|nr:hypothetical protein [Flavobacterium psychrophilum]SNA75919.1 conserved hypothetical protein [Flavobacterium psychrophilum]
MTIEILAGEFHASTEVPNYTYWLFQIRYNDAQEIISNNENVLLKYKNNTINISSGIYGDNYNGQPPYGDNHAWSVVEQLDGLHGTEPKWWLRLIVLNNGFFNAVQDINNITAIEINTFLPALLHFEGVKDFCEPVAQVLNQTYGFNFTIEASSWLQVTPNSGTGATALSIVPAPTPTMLVGSYVGFVNIKNGAILYKVINITYNLTTIVKTPYQYKGVNFTLDTKYFNFKSQNSDTYFQTNAIIKVFSFFTDTAKIIQVPQKVLTFETVEKLNLGRIIHRLMNRFDKKNDYFYQYKYAELQLNVIEKLISNDTVIRNVNSDTIFFAAGLSKGVERGFGFLNINQKPNRVTKKSFAYLNILIPQNILTPQEGAYLLKIFKNKELVPTETIDFSNIQGNIFTYKIYFDSYNQGDIIDVVLDKARSSLISPPTKSFLVFPEGEYSAMIVWENEYLLQSAIECTGGYNIKTDIESVYQKIYKDFVEILEILATSKEVKLNVSTGWVAKTDVDTIESLLRSKRAWLLKNNQVIHIRALNKSILNEDSSRGLIDYNLEFQINRSYDEETYSL